MALVSFTVSGYRGVTGTLENLGLVNFIYGLNGAGKTNLLRAIDLYFRLVNRSVWEVYEPFEYELDTFLGTFGQRAGLLTQDVPLELQGEIRGLGPLRFTCTLRGRKVQVATSAAACAEAFLGHQNSVRTLAGLAPAVPSSDVQAAADSALRAAEEAWSPLREHATARLTLPVALPLTAEVRRDLVTALQSRDLATRRRAEDAVRTVTEFLGWDSPIGPVGSDDLALLCAPIARPLTELGSAAQSLLGLLASTCGVAANYLLLSEPECHSNPAIHPQIAVLIETLCADGAQAFVETHSARFAPVNAKIFLLEREAEQTTIRTLSPQDLTRFESRPRSARPPIGSMLAYDNTVELSAPVRIGLGLHVGDFVYFLERANGWQVVTRAEFEKECGGPE